MIINRRGFLKGLGVSPLVILTKREEEKAIPNNSDRVLTYHSKRLIFQDPQFAYEYLLDLIEGKTKGHHSTYASSIDSAAKAIHTGIWSSRVSINDVTNKYVPLLERAKDSINIYDKVETKKHNPHSTKDNHKYESFAMHVQACVQLRIFNLDNYLKRDMSNWENAEKRVKKEGKYKFIE